MGSFFIMFETFLHYLVEAFLVITYNIIEPRREKTNILVSDLVRHKPVRTATEDG